MRKTAGKQANESILLGDRARAEELSTALAQSSEESRLTHGFHTYPAGLHPDAAAALVAAFPSEAVLDPFCGGGTVLVEARAAGRRAVGRDLSPVAIRVARARTGTPDEAHLTRVRSRARKLTEAARSAEQPPEERIAGVLEQWYAPHVLCELESLRAGIAASEPELRPLLEVAFSSILVKVSWRKSDTSARREKHERPAGTAAILFHKKVRELGRRIAALREVVPPGTPEADIVRGDARALSVDPVDLVLTSPPYPSTYDYLPLQHLRHVWLGDHVRDEHEIGPRRAWRAGERAARRAWQRDTLAWTQAAAGALVEGGHLVVVIGDGHTPAGAVDASAPTEAAAREAGLVAVARASVARPDHARGIERWEHVFAFHKPGE